MRFHLLFAIICAGCVGSGADPQFSDFSLSEAAANGRRINATEGQKSFTTEVCGSKMDFRPRWSPVSIAIEMSSDRGEKAPDSFRLIEADVLAEGLETYEDIFAYSHIGPPIWDAKRLPLEIGPEQQVTKPCLGLFRDVKDKTFEFSLVFECQGEPVRLTWNGRLPQSP